MLLHFQIAFLIVLSLHRKIFISKSLALLQYLLNPFLTLPLLIAGYGSIGIVVISTLLTIGVLISNIYYCMKKIQAKFSFQNLEFSTLKEMWCLHFLYF